MDLRAIEWLLKEKYGLRESLHDPDSWPQEMSEDLKRIEKQEPLAYVIGFVHFLDCLIDLRFRPLIPRVETEFWTGLLIDRFKDKKQSIFCLDLFAGSGCIGIAILRHLPYAKVDFTDNSKDCLEQIKLNLSLNKISSDRFRLIQTDIFEGITDQYDLITANPPYIGEESFDQLPDSVKCYEPASALISKDDGLYLIKRFLKAVPKYLKKDGSFWLEFDSAQKEKITEIINPEFQYYFGQDQYEQWRFLIAQKNFD